MLIKPRGCTFGGDNGLPNAAQNINGPMADPLCNVKSVEFLQNRSGHEDYRTEIGKWFEERREEHLASAFDFKGPEAPGFQQE